MSLAELLAPVWAELGSIKKRLPSVSPATVTSVGPIRIQIDGQGSPVAASPDTLVPVGPGDRVRVLRYGTTHLILGRVNTKGVPYAMSVGIVTVDHNDSQYGNGTITFPAGRFTVPPVVTASASSNLFNVGTGTATTSGCNIHSRTITQEATTGTATIRWIAVQMTPTSAEG